MFIDSHLFRELILTCLSSINEDLTCISITVFVQLYNSLQSANCASYPFFFTCLFLPQNSSLASKPFKFKFKSLPLHLVIHMK